jgi:hypothetical protein
MRVRNAQASAGLIYSVENANFASGESGSGCRRDQRGAGLALGLRQTAGPASRLRERYHPVKFPAGRMQWCRCCADGEL